MRALPLALVLVFLAAGCLGAGGPTGDGRGPVPVDFDHLTGRGALVEDRAETRTFLFEGNVGLGGSVPLAGTAPGAAGAEHTFQVDGTVGFVEASLESLDAANLVFLLRDEQGRVACGAAAGRPSCTAPLAANATAAEWSAEIQSRQNDPDNPYRLNVTLHPRHHISFGQVAGALDPRFAFRLSDTGRNGAEPTLGLTSNGHVFVVEGTATMRSRDDGGSWEVVTAPLTTTSLDPMLYVDPWTDRVFVDHLYVACSYLSWSDNEGASWVTNPAACGEPADDHQKLCVGAHPVPGNPVFDGTVYYTFNSFALLVDGAGHITASRSLDGGATWQPSVAMSETLDFPYRTGGPCAADRDGNVYIGAYLQDGGFAVAASNDHGVLWNAVRAGTDSGAGQGIDPGVAIDAAGNAYGAYWGPKGIQVVVSRDHGASWSDQRTVSPEGLESFVLVDAIAGDEGRVAVAYLATADSDKGPNRADGWSRWHLYLSMTENALAEAPVWVSARVTPESDPVQIGTICTGGTGCFGGNRNLLDFIDVQVGPDGRVYVAYTDGCREGCVELPQDSRARRGMVAIQEDGPRLFAEKAPWVS